MCCITITIVHTYKCSVTLWSVAKLHADFLPLKGMICEKESEIVNGWYIKRIIWMELSSSADALIWCYCNWNSPSPSSLFSSPYSALSLLAGVWLATSCALLPPCPPGPACVRWFMPRQQLSPTARTPLATPATSSIVLFLPLGN